jgi:sirohydrochlorin ferrochelatase
MKALLIVAHGSRRQQSNQEVCLLAERLNQRHGDEFDLITPAFLELAAPLIPAGIQHCVEQGASSVVVLPYFLNSGKHVTEDIPAILNSVKTQYPDIKIELREHIGASEIMPDLVMQTARQD